jgi:hypothetical protein
MSSPLDLTGAQRQQRLAAIKRLDLGFFIHTQDQRVVRWIEVKPRDITHFFDEQRVLRQLEAFGPVRLQRKRPPDPTDHGLTQPAALGHRPRAPMGGIRRSAFQGPSQHPLNLFVTHLARRARPRFVEQAPQPLRHEALAPFAHRLGQAELLGDCGVGRAARAGQDDPRALRQRLCALAPPRSSASRSSIPKLKGAIGLPVRISFPPPIPETLTLANKLASVGVSRYEGLHRPQQHLHYCGQAVFPVGIYDLQ